MNSLGSESPAGDPDKKGAIMGSRVFPRETSVSSHVSGASALKSDIREISPLSYLNSSVTFKVRILQEKRSFESTSTDLLASSLSIQTAD